MLLVFLLGIVAAISPHSVKGDFDHDGRIDVAEFVPGKAGNYRLIIRSGKRGRPVYVVDEVKRHDLPDTFLTKMPHGRWRTWCGKGGGEDGDPCPYRSVTIRGDTLTYGTKESSQAIALWTGKKFEVVWLSD